MPLDQPTIQEGDTGDAVARLQEDLVTVGYLAEGEDTTGEFGPATTAAVTQLQTDSGLDPNGVVGPETWFALEGPSPTVESSFDLSEFPSFALVVRHADEADANGYLADLGIDPV
jgi:peptidoglycan hydrolase-like protein with peptidoglycan-binding domain